YFWGLKGKPSLNLQKICVDQKPYGVQRLKSPEDITIGIIALGFYTPATVRVWCGD
ncbi:MAG: Bor/Iss family lipoprotein, partial [Bdellovibrionales bacterium]